MIEILLILGIASGVTILLSQEWYSDLLTKFKILDTKPINCELCLAFWISLLSCIVLELPVLNCVLIALITGITSSILFRYYNRL